MRAEVGAGLAALLIAASVFCAAASDELAGMGLRSAGHEDLKVETSQRWGPWPDEGSQWTLAAGSGSSRLRLRAFGGLKPAAADKKKELELSRIRLLYAGDIGYPGMITRALEVPKSLSPRTLDRGAGKPSVTFLPASAALTYGVGSEDLVVYRAGLSFLYCPKSRRLFELEWFEPKAAFDVQSALAALDGFSCAR